MCVLNIAKRITQAVDNTNIARPTLYPLNTPPEVVSIDEDSISAKPEESLVYLEQESLYHVHVILRSPVRLSKVINIIICMIKKYWSFYYCCLLI